MDSSKPPNPKPNPHSPMRVLTRPSQPPPPHQPPPPPPHPSTAAPPPLPPPHGGVVVIGFISLHRTTTSAASHLIDLITDSDAFSSPSILRRRALPLSDLSPTAITYYHDPDSGLVFLQSRCPASSSSVGDAVEELEFGDLQSMLFMFTVCHVIIFIQEGSRFDTQVLKSLRVLQSAKHALVPFLRSHSMLPSINRPSTSSLRPPTSASSSKSPSPRRGSSMSSRNGSHVSVMSGLGSYTTLFPGQCTPVTLFAFIDDFSDLVNASAVPGESKDSSSSSQSDLSSLGRQNHFTKGSTSVVVLSRPVNKSEGGLRKKLQSSLEAQIRFLIKKCRTLSGSESGGHVGSRNGAISGSAPLLTLDASRAIVLLDNSSIKRGASLDYATGLVEEVLNGKAASDSLLLENHNQSGNKEDILTIKEFISRQADILRGKGGSVANANSGSAAGVGMVAVAAAAAAASTASGRATSVPDLPSFEMWLSSSQLIFKGILSAKRGSADETDNIRRKFRQRNGTPPIVDGGAPKGPDPLDVAVSLLESGEGINRKFSALWCQRALPAAMEVYLKDLPPCYPTSQHDAHLEQALHAFHSMVKGPSAQQFMKKLEEECLSIWKSGRQLCDAISLSGKPCMHPRHGTENDGSLSDAKAHSSGFVFLHACACGRTRQLRPDPFDFESANIKFNIFPDCDKLLPVLQLPRSSINGPIQPSSWTIVRLGGARYYDPSKGLIQTGFASQQKFLLRWTIVLETDKGSNVSFANALRRGTLKGTEEVKSEPTAEEDAKKNAAVLVQPGEVQARVDEHRKAIEHSGSDHKQISFGRGLPREVQTGVEGHGKDLSNSKPDHKQISFGKGLPNITMKKAFSEVVAGSASSSSAFPPLQPKILSAPGPGKSLKKHAAKIGSMEQINVSTSELQRSEKSKETVPAGEGNSSGTGNVGRIDGNPLLHIGRMEIPLSVDDGRNADEKNLADGGKPRFNPSCKHFVVHIGFEHECPRGHRFILSPDLLNQLGQPYSLPEEVHVARPVERVNRRHRGPSKFGKTDGHNKAQRQLHGNATLIHTASSLKRSGEVGRYSGPAVDGKSHLSKPVEQPPLDASKPPDSVSDLQQSHHYVNLDDNGPAYSLLNRNLPIYLNCPYCIACKNNKDKHKFAGTISQLQRIFVVTPPFPLVLATNPIIQFEGSCNQPADVLNSEQKLEFSLGCQVILPPESFVSIRLPFVYGTEVKNKGWVPLKPFEHQPELTAWILQGTVLHAVCKGSSLG